MTQYPNQPDIPDTKPPPGFPEHLDFAAPPSITFDADEFLQFLDDEDWTIEQKIAYVQALWPVVVALLDWNFSFHPVQEAIDAAKQLERAMPQ